MGRESITTREIAYCQLLEKIFVGGPFLFLLLPFRRVQRLSANSQPKYETATTTRMTGIEIVDPTCLRASPF